jgi:uncharacterized protein YyaL (SSP411 family)
MTARHDLEEKALQIQRAFSEVAGQLPSGYANLMASAEFGVGATYEVVIAGMQDAADSQEMIGALRSQFLPNAVLLFRPAEEESPEIASMIPFLEHHLPVDGKATAYVCTNNACQTPTTDIGEMLKQLK